MSEQTLSDRGQKNVSAGEAFDKLVEIFTNVYDKDSNPDGIISLGVAENGLMHKELAAYFNKIIDRRYFTDKKKLDINTRHLTYGDGPFGTRALRSALSNFFNDYFSPVNKVLPEHLVLAGGVTSVIDLITFAIANPGDGILVGRPLYTSFPNDVRIRADAKLVAVSSEGKDPMGEEMVQQYEKELVKQEKAGTKIRAIILARSVSNNSPFPNANTNSSPRSPHNPLGLCYNPPRAIQTKDTLKAYMRFCQKHRIHFISDEVYAKSIYAHPDNTHSVPFTSALSIDTASLIDPSLVHILYGMSKDFSCNGLRSGVLLTQHNAPLIKSVKSVALFSWPASVAELYWTHMLNDRPFLEYYFEENSKRLAEGYTTLTSFLKEHGIGWVKGSNAGFYIWVDFRNLLGKDIRVEDDDDDKVETVAMERPSQVYKTSKKASERDDWFFQKIIKAKVFVASGNAFFAEEHGWYRVSFSIPKEVLEVGLERLGRVLEEVKREEVDG
ncbi:MAG: hypothetical protein Q9216_001573 [Gyalolechia sp. 2 TL-2023]